MRNIRDYIALILVAFPLFLFRISIIPVRLLGYAVEVNMYKDLEDSQ